MGVRRWVSTMARGISEGLRLNLRTPSSLHKSAVITAGIWPDASGANSNWDSETRPARSSHDRVLPK